MNKTSLTMENVETNIFEHLETTKQLPSIECWHGETDWPTISIIL